MQARMDRAFERGSSLAGWDKRVLPGGGSTDSSKPSLSETYYTNWAYLSSVGVPDGNNKSVKFPLLIGEFGSVFNSSADSDEEVCIYLEGR